ncbi:hypothetical protein MMC11_000811 [Xylographa trunciseda]|nr:hypothetical protein [Xylographa trunciseda]
MASSAHPEFSVGWYLDQLQQSSSNLSSELSTLVNINDKTLSEFENKTNETSAPATNLHSQKIKNIVLDYLCDETGERFWPSQSTDLSSKQLQWSIEADKKKIIELLIGLTYLKVLYRKKNHTLAVRNAGGARHTVVTNSSSKNNEIGKNWVDQLAAAGNSAALKRSSLSKRRRGENISTVGTEGNPAIQVPASNKRLSDTLYYVQGEAYHKKRARKMLENAKLAAVFCTSCTAAKIDCYVTDGRDKCAFCISRGVRISDCKRPQPRVHASSQDVADTITLNGAHISSPPPRLLNIATQALNSLDVPRRAQKQGRAQASDGTAQQIGVVEPSSNPGTSPVHPHASSSRRSSTLPKESPQYIDLTRTESDAIEEIPTTPPHPDLKPEFPSSTGIEETPEPATKRSSNSDIPAKQEPPSSPGSQTIPDAQIKQEPSLPEIIFRFFFASHSSLPPVEKPASSHSTMESFFDEAHKVWSTVVPSAARDQPMIGVEVSWDPPGAASTIQWREPSGYDLMMSRVKRAAPNVYGEVVVGVKCISRLAEREPE